MDGAKRGNTNSSTDLNSGNVAGEDSAVNTPESINQ